MTQFNYFSNRVELFPDLTDFAKKEKKEKKFRVDYKSATLLKVINFATTVKIVICNDDTSYKHVASFLFSYCDIIESSL